MSYVITCKCSSGLTFLSVRLKKKDMSRSSHAFIRQIATSFFFKGLFQGTPSSENQNQPWRFAHFLLMSAFSKERAHASI